MKRLIFAIMLAAAIAIPAAGQTPTTTTPQSVTQANVLNGVSAATTSGCLSNLGQNVHFAFYSSGGATGNPTNIQIRIEGSYNSDSATCTTGTWFAISDDGTTPAQNGNNLIFGIGTFPFLRINLVKCTCDAADTVSASYTGTSSEPGNPFGAYGAGQQIRKVAFMLQAGGSVTSPNFVPPYGSTAGFLVVVGSAVFTAGSISARCVDGGSSASSSMTLTTSSAAFPVTAAPCNLVNVRCQACALSGGTFSAIWFFYPPGAALPGGAQPSNTANSEATSGANAAVSTTLTASSIGQRGHLFSVSARCSAGTAQLTVADGATQIYSTSATQVGTTNFDKTWPVGLASTAGNNLVITLGTCGVANTGTLDVQGSVF
jgi:hypothetical protein